MALPKEQTVDDLDIKHIRNAFDTYKKDDRGEYNWEYLTSILNRVEKLELTPRDRQYLWIACLYHAVELDRYGNIDPKSLSRFETEHGKNTDCARNVINLLMGLFHYEEFEDHPLYCKLIEVIEGDFKCTPPTSQNQEN